MLCAVTGGTLPKQVRDCLIQETSASKTTDWGQLASWRGGTREDHMGTLGTVGCSGGLGGGRHGPRGLAIHPLSFLISLRDSVVPPPPRPHQAPRPAQPGQGSPCACPSRPGSPGGISLPEAQWGPVPAQGDGPARGAPFSRAPVPFGSATAPLESDPLARLPPPDKPTSVGWQPSPPSLSLASPGPKSKLMHQHGCHPEQSEKMPSAIKNLLF